MLKEKLKIGVLINSNDILSWQTKIIEDLKNSRFAEITVVTKKNNLSPNNSPKFSRLFKNTEKKIFDLHLKLDEIILGGNTDYSKTCNTKILLKGVNEITVSPISRGFTDVFDEDDIKKIKNFNLDIILKFGFKMLSGGILSAAKYGVWSYEADDPAKEYNPLGYLEVINKRNTTHSIVKILNEEPLREKVIHRSEMLTHNISISKNRNACYWRASSVIPRIIEGLYNYGETYLIRLEKNNKEINFYNHNGYEEVSSFTAIKNVFKHLWKVSKRAQQKIFFNDHWDVLFKINSNEKFFPAIEDFKLLPTPVDRFWADPFVISKDNRHYVFVEELLYKTKKGHIAVIELDDNGIIIQSKKVLEKPYHLSYPFLFEHDGTYYMMPETGGNKTIELYKCREFPYQWEFVMNLMEGIDTADATIFYYNNKWWLFCCIDKSGKNVGMLDELYLFFSDNLFTNNWQSHPNNPVCTNTRTARPAGKIFTRNGKIYRPSQDCSGIYGRGININQILKLSETVYEEAVIKKLIPGADIDFIGIHTFNSAEDITVIDAFKYRRKTFRISLSK